MAETRESSLIFLAPIYKMCLIFKNLEEEDWMFDRKQYRVNTKTSVEDISTKAHCPEQVFVLSIFSGHPAFPAPPGFDRRNRGTRIDEGVPESRRAATGQRRAPAGLSTRQTS